MSYYSKTELGWQRLNNRDGNLNARQRRLLVLIGSEDFNDLNPTQKNLFAPEYHVRNYIYPLFLLARQIVRVHRQNLLV